jgi:hypothetical protein
MAGRRRVEHDSATERRLASQNHAVTAGRDDRGREAKLRPPVFHPRNTRRHFRCAHVGVDARAVSNRLELVERDIQPVGDRIRAGRHEDVASCDVPPLEPGQAHCDPLSGSGPLDVAIVDLNAPRSDASAGRLEAQLVALADRPRPERPGDDRADAAQGECAVDPEPGGLLHCTAHDAVGGATERRT